MSIRLASIWIGGLVIHSALDFCNFEAIYRAMGPGP